MKRNNPHLGEGGLMRLFSIIISVIFSGFLLTPGGHATEFVSEPNIGAEQTQPQSIDIPSQRRQNIRISVEKSQIATVIEKHRLACTRLGANICRIEEVSFPNANVYRPTGMLKLRFANGRSEPFVQSIISSRKSGIVDRQDSGYGGRQEVNVPQLLLEKELLLAERKQMEAKKEGIDAELDSFLKRKLNDVDRELERIEEQLKEKEQKFGSEELEISYDEMRNNSSNGYDRMREELWIVLLYGFFGSLGIALITVVYLGILAFAFLGLRKLAQKWGLIKGKKVTLPQS
ncbi:hypothetical protein ACFOWX_09415 [Sphingorhabdus arenilitoris]|uniref:DUF4349 domain-containing protein n=1 Tax=Sphingorhabdus arenilitoris TaxID=1490041 RepID=A0ABV8RHA4_9SPHN